MSSIAEPLLHLIDTFLEQDLLPRFPSDCDTQPHWSIFSSLRTTPGGW